MRKPDNKIVGVEFLDFTLKSETLFNKLLFGFEFNQIVLNQNQHKQIKTGLKVNVVPGLIIGCLGIETDT